MSLSFFEPISQYSDYMIPETESKSPNDQNIQIQVQSRQKYAINNQFEEYSLLKDFSPGKEKNQ